MSEEAGHYGSTPPQFKKRGKQPQQPLLDRTDTFMEWVGVGLFIIGMVLTLIGATLHLWK